MSVSKKALATALAAAISAGAVVPAAQAATTTTTTKTRTSVYHIRVNDGILAGGGNVVRVKAVTKNPDQSVRSWYSRSTIQKVVRTGVNNQIQKAYRSHGYGCVPTLDGSMNASTARFTCKLQGADVPTTVTVTYTAAFKPATAG